MNTENKPVILSLFQEKKIYDRPMHQDVHNTSHISRVM